MVHILPSIILLILPSLYHAQTYYEPWTEIFAHYSYVDSNDIFAIYWNTPTIDDKIEIGISCQSLGYCSFGISSEGFMINSDIIIGWIDNDNIPHLENRYTLSSNQQPLYMNDQTNIQLIDAFIDSTTTYLHFTRKLYPCNDYSQPIPLGTARTIYAWNDNKPTLRSDDITKYNILYHALNRGSQSINLQTGDSIKVDMPQDVETIDITVDNFQIPSNSTTYYCQLYELPQQFETEHHAIRIDPIITEGNEGFVHHMTFFYCPTQYVDPQMVGFGEICDKWRNMALNTTECISGAMVYGWALGRKEFYLPAHVGIELGGNEATNIRYIMMNVHYNNPNGITDRIDNSGVTIWYTPTLRDNGAGVLAAGINSGPLAQFIPRGMKSVKNYGYCLSYCSDNPLSGIPQQGVTIYMVNVHAHFKAINIRVRHIRGDQELPYIVWNTNYDFHYQQSVLLDEIVTFLPGDEIIVECTYDTSNENSMTYGGERADDEMCLAFFGVYPKMDLSWCVTGFGQQKRDDFFNEAEQNGYYNAETDFYDITIAGALQFYQYLWTTPQMLQGCLNMTNDFIGYGFAEIPNNFRVYPEPQFGDCSASSDDKFIWDWNEWYNLVLFGGLFVILVTFGVYCACTCGDRKYKKFKSIGSELDYGATTSLVSTDNN